MASQYTHKVVFESNDAKTTVKVHRNDSLQSWLKHDLFTLAHTVTVQEYPLKNNKIDIVKGMVEDEQI